MARLCGFILFLVSVVIRSTSWRRWWWWWWWWWWSATWWLGRWRRRGGPEGGQGSSRGKYHHGGCDQYHGKYHRRVGKVIWKRSHDTGSNATDNNILNYWKPFWLQRHNGNIKRRQLTLLAFGRQSRIEKTSLAFPSGSFGRNTPTASTSIWAEATHYYHHYKQCFHHSDYHYHFYCPFLTFPSV